jgi:hypothetical protein
MKSEVSGFSLQSARHEREGESVCYSHHTNIPQTRESKRKKRQEIGATESALLQHLRNVRPVHVADEVDIDLLHIRNPATKNIPSCQALQYE